ncbi:hypothetical protein AV530_006382 [Patagioenas fasciata monilis]|uniref:Uncharacterized protein n=1 Tax=Patagioenas fasciata monilis TaxID=372326 RepID=A0A1V4KGA2_PATFA|nr:hypothetical protein AV530_006382 [Patagioenas fasciata monilis]
MTEEQSDEEEQRLELEDVLLPLRALQQQKLSSSLLRIVDQMHRGPSGFLKEEHRCFAMAKDDRKMSKNGKVSRLGEAPAEVSTAGRMKQLPPGCCCRRRDDATFGMMMPGRCCLRDDAAFGMLLLPGQGRCHDPFSVLHHTREGVGLNILLSV